MKPKKVFKALGIAFLSLVVIPSCSDFLNEGPKTALTEDEIFSDSTYIESNLQSLYANWKELFRDRYLWECMVGTDEIQSGAYQALKENNGLRGALDMYNALLTSELSYVTEQWDMRWPTVGEAAKIINAIDIDNVINDVHWANLYGEACFIRGSLMMELAMLWGAIPIIDLARIDELGYGRQPLEDVWEFIINDLIQAASYCPDTNNYARATLYAANMMLGYAYMSAPESTGLRNFDKAADALRVVVEGPFSLVPYNELWDYETPNTTEAIFEWQFNPYTDHNAVEFQIGSRAVAALPEADHIYFAGYDHAVPTEWAYSSISEGGLWEDGDVRREESIRYDFTYNGQVPTLESISWEQLGDDHDELLPHIKKYEDYRTDGYSGYNINNVWYSGKNMPFLRLANAKLLYAECLNETGFTDEAVRQVNDVRSRAWGI